MNCHSVLAPIGAQGVTISVRSSIHVCLELSIFNPQAINQESVSSQWAVSEQSVSRQRALGKHPECTQRAHSREQSVNTQSIKIRVNTVRASKYCVLFLKISQNINRGSALKLFFIAWGYGRRLAHKILHIFRHLGIAAALSALLQPIVINVENSKPIKEVFHQLVLENWCTQFSRWWKWHGGVMRIL